MWKGFRDTDGRKMELLHMELSLILSSPLPFLVQFLCECGFGIMHALIVEVVDNIYTAQRRKTEA